MKNITIYLISIILLIGLSMGFNTDPRIAYSVPFLAPDPSLKTTDSFYGGSPDNPTEYALPPIFGGLQPTIEYNNKTQNIKYTNVSAYDLPEYIMIRANISMGAENWL